MTLISGCDRNAVPVEGNEIDASDAAPDSPDPETEVAVDQVTGRAAPAAQDQAQYVGSRRCGSCHQDQLQAWQGSHHDLAMQEVSEESVLGEFDGSGFSYHGTVSRFYRKDGSFFVQTDGPDGKLQHYPIAYTFGAFPLQQYLVELPGGRLQALPLAWDSRSEAGGGQRWFHLYPDEEIAPGDPLHWTGINQNWNFMCADCHSTNLRKNFDRGNNQFATQWSEIDVGCEACHGPGARHVEWAETRSPSIKDKGLNTDFSGRMAVAWHMDTASGVAHPDKPEQNQVEIQACAGCHARRSTAYPGASPGSDLLDYYNLALLEEGLYHPDGQVDGEVFVYGSFLQSKMHAAGVTCSNCHEPHSLELRVEGNGLCTQCHQSGRFDTAAHHFHPPGSSASRCINCHMPAKDFMVVDTRRDHSFRIPRPDLSEALATPNVCTDCHQDREHSWAAGVLAKKFGPPEGSHYGEAIHAGRRNLPGAPAALSALVADESQPSIARATAVGLLGRYPSRESAQLLQMIAQQDDPLLELGLAQGLEALPEQLRPALGIPLLFSQQRVTRGLAANALAGTPIERYPQSVQEQFAIALHDYLQSETYNADRPESLVNLAGLHAQRGNVDEAERFFRQAMSGDPTYTPAYINLAELYRTTGREQAAEQLLRQALDRADEKAAVLHSLGLSLVRQQRTSEAQEYLRRATREPAATARYTYVYAVALHSSGKPGRALQVLEQGLGRYPGDAGILSALVTYHREAGNSAEARTYEQRLRALSR
nr:tetratricopeptide repeat protein [Microbulbifer sediminum]